jgi:hypothetical protein
MTPEKETMTTTEHLQKIKLECERLLTISEKRTQGKWISSHDPFKQRWQIDAWLSPFGGANIGRCGPNGAYEASYIAACAGAAEAGWRSTIASINRLTLTLGALPLGHYAMPPLIAMRDEILAAWPTELLP